MSLEERHWPSFCIIVLLLALSVVAVVEVCADATPVINAVLNSAIAINFDLMVSSIVNWNNTTRSALVPLVGKGGLRIALSVLVRSAHCRSMQRWVLNGRKPPARAVCRSVSAQAT